jgi:hypothetical protein
MRKYQVLYEVNGREHASPWFTNRECAERALALIRAKHGPAVIYVD